MSPLASRSRRAEEDLGVPTKRNPTCPCLSRKPLRAIQNLEKLFSGASEFRVSDKKSVSEHADARWVVTALERPALR